MIISFYSIELTLESVITNWVSLFAANTYNSMGSFTLELQNTEENSNLVKLWKYCTIDNDNDNVYVITSANVTAGKIVLTGFPATYILKFRASTEVIAKTQAEEAMLTLVSNMTGWKNIVVNEPTEISAFFGNQISDKQIIEYLQGIGQATDVGFRFRKAGRSLVFECYKPPINNRVKYSTSLKNVTNLDYLISENEYYNCAIVAGAGEGSKRVTVTVSIGSPADAELRELYVDARNEQPEETETAEEYKERLRLIGLQKLSEQLKTETLSFSVGNDDDVKLGDIINVSLDEFGIIVQVRVTEEQILNQKNVTTRTICVGTPLKIIR